MGGPLDGSGHELGEKADKGQKFNQVGGGFQMPSVHVDGVAQRLKGVKTDADRQDDVQVANLNGLPQKGEGPGKAVDEKVVVFEKSQQAEVG